MKKSGINISFEQWNQTLSLVYEAAMAPELWRDALISISQSINCHSGQLIISNSNTPFSIIGSTCGLDNDESIMNDFAVETENGINTRMNFSQALKTPTVLTDYSHSSEAQMARDPFYQGFLKRSDAQYYGGLVLESDKTGGTGLAMLRSATQGHFTERECQYMESLAPHLQRAIQLTRFSRVDNFIRGKESILENFNVGVFVLDRYSEIAHMNGKASAIVARQDGISDANKHITLNDPKAQLALNQDIRTLSFSKHTFSETTFQYISATRKNCSSSYLLMVTPLFAMEDIISGVSCLVCVIDPDAQELNLSQILKSVFQLTDAEAKLAEALYKGTSLKEYAERLSVTIETPRYHLKNIFSKLSVSKQSELIKKISSSAAVLANLEKPS
ncbi:MAG: helix-turn-helix transcriptional regulator [Pseudomonadales bacterium]|nr:helix-turn-helix transcriptional regulator [Pseudomonadales bacterium]